MTVCKFNVLKMFLPMMVFVPWVDISRVHAGVNVRRIVNTSMINVFMAVEL